jgi:hypothetical protein
MAIKNKRLGMSIRTTSLNPTLHQRNNLIATIRLYNSRSLLDAKIKTGNCEKVYVCVCVCVCVCFLQETLI